MAAHLHEPIVESDVRQRLSRLRVAQASWSTLPIRDRLVHLRRLRNTIARDPQALLEAVRLARPGRPEAEILISELLPFLDAIKFLESHAEKLLRPMKVSNRARPFWLAGVELETHREPIGLALIITPCNYPLFLPGVQIVQALAAGNAIAVKPGTGGSPAALALCRYVIASGVPEHLLTVLDESAETAADAISAGVDKIWLTGSAITGRKVAKLASETLTPLACELSGCDAVIVLPGANLALAARAIDFGLNLNASQTCMRPHRLLVHASLEAAFRQAMLSRISEVKIAATRETISRIHELARDARSRGATQLHGAFNDGTVSPYMFSGVAPESSLWNADVFAPILAMNTFADLEDAARLHNASSYGLTVSIFGPESRARELAPQLQAGTVIINDVIVPTADPRLPFSGRKQSGYGSTRGAEGFLEFTQLKALTVRRSKHRHLEPAHSSDAAMFMGAIAAAHGGEIGSRVRGAFHAIKIALRRATKV